MTVRGVVLWVHAKKSGDLWENRCNTVDKFVPGDSSPQSKSPNGQMQKPEWARDAQVWRNQMSSLTVTQLTDAGDRRGMLNQAASNSILTGVCIEVPEDPECTPKCEDSVGQRRLADA